MTMGPFIFSRGYGTHPHQETLAEARSVPTHSGQAGASKQILARLFFLPQSNGNFVSLVVGALVLWRRFPVCGEVFIPRRIAIRQNFCGAVFFFFFFF